MQITDIRKILNAYGLGNELHFTYIEAELRRRFDSAWGKKSAKRFSLMVDDEKIEDVHLNEEGIVIYDGELVEQKERLFFINRVNWRVYTLDKFYEDFVKTRANEAAPNLEGAFTKEELDNLPYGDVFDVGYHSGKRVNFKALTMGPNDKSRKHTFELEFINVLFKLVTELFKTTKKFRLIGKPEQDSSINVGYGATMTGGEIPLVPISKNRWDSPGFKKEMSEFLAEFGSEGFDVKVSSGKAGGHQHVDKDGFDPYKPEEYENFLKLYYAINCKELREFWLTISKRPSNDDYFWKFSESLGEGCNGRKHIVNSANKNCMKKTMEDIQIDPRDITGNPHRVALNNQHPKTLEFRFWNATFNLKILEARVQIIDKLMDLILEGRESICVDDLRNAGEEAKWYINVNTRYGPEKNPEVNFDVLRIETFESLVANTDFASLSSLNRADLVARLHDLARQFGEVAA